MLDQTTTRLLCIQKARPLFCRYIQTLVEAEIASGIDSKRIMVAGFSQVGDVTPPPPPSYPT